MKKNHIYSKQLSIFFVLFTQSVFSQSPCSGVPGANSVLGPTASICPGVITLSLANTYSVSGITYQWQMSTASNIGPFAAIPGATLSSVLALATNSLTYYNAVITCTNGNNIYTTSVLQVSVAPGTTINSPPYFEGFEGISANNTLPNCSWAASNLGSTCLTYTNGGGATGSKYAAFYYSPSGTSSFYSNGVQLNAGVTYSAAVWYNTGFNSSATWSNFSILVGPNQSAAGQITVASTPGNAITNVYTSLSNTFTVPNSGLYYIGVKATSNGTGWTQYLSWDDLTITIPCSVGNNKPSINLVASSTLVCSGPNSPPVTFTASSVNTHSWNTGATGTITTYTANIIGSGNVSVIGTNTLSGCSNSAVIALSVIPAPNIFIFANKLSVCAGGTVVLNAGGASDYTWSTGEQTNIISVSPTVTTTYTLIASNNNGCTTTGSVVITVNPLPLINVVSSVLSNKICKGEVDTLIAIGANSYQWNSSQTTLAGSQIIVSPNITTTYVVIGTDVNGCSSQTNFVLQVNECTGLIHLTSVSLETSVSPNPFHEQFLLKTGALGLKTILITDLSGRTVLSLESIEEKIIINTRYFSEGIYYVKIKSDEKITIFKTIKN